MSVVRLGSPPGACRGGGQRPKIVFLLVAGANGPVERNAAQENAIDREIAKGNVILMGNCVGYGEALRRLDRDFRQRLEDIQVRLVDAADEVFVFNPDGGLGDESAQNLVAYALGSKKLVRTLQPVDLEGWQVERTRQMNAAAVRNLEG